MLANLVLHWHNEKLTRKTYLICWMQVFEGAGVNCASVFVLGNNLSNWQAMRGRLDNIPKLPIRLVLSCY